MAPADRLNLNKIPSSRVLSAVLMRGVYNPVGNSYSTLTVFLAKTRNS